MELERKIEKWLRAFAKKRRADAGDFKLHPATRRLLQNEVARRAQGARSDSGEEQPSLWQLFRQQWAFLIGFALIIFLAATMFLPNLAASKNRAKSALAANKLKEVGVAVQIAAEQDNGKLPASLDELTNQFSGRVNSAGGGQIVYLGAGKDLDNLESNDVLAFSPANKDQHAILYADGRVELADKKRFEALTNQAPMQLALRKTETVANGLPVSAAAPMPPVESPASAQFDESRSKLQSAKLAAPVAAAGQIASAENLRTDSWTFSSGTSQITGDSSFAQNTYRNIAGRKATPVLASFQIQQNGSAVRVVDRDGSVYSGSLLQMEKALARNSPAVPESAILASNVQQFQNYFFRVTGTNQTLQQKVVFTANVIASTNADLNQMNDANFGSSGGGGAGGERRQIETRSQQSLWSNSRIAGEAIVAGTNKIEINAEPAP
ncbi:MAG TPA: hypothetical protein VFV23_04905 [Verrucomicrobiae bacterium]|nr:hypothetical protein [Verrucomicrobiae bacterium]